MEQTIIADALDNLRVHQRQLDIDGIEIGVSRQALNEAITHIGRLTADRDFWKERFQTETRARVEAESLSRTGAVKDAESARDALRELASVKMDLSLEDWCRISNTILSALEPAEPEGGQEAVDAGWLMDWQGRHDVVMKASAFKELSAALDRPSEQAVTEAGKGLLRIVEEIDGAMKHGTWRDEEGMRLKDTPEWVAFYNALKAAMEAGRGC